MGVPYLISQNYIKNGSLSSFNRLSFKCLFLKLNQTKKYDDLVLD